MAAELHLSNGETVVIQQHNALHVKNELGRAAQDDGYLCLSQSASGAEQFVNPSQVVRITNRPDADTGGWQLT